MKELQKTRRASYVTGEIPIVKQTDKYKLSAPRLIQVFENTTTSMTGLTNCQGFDAIEN